MNQEHRQRKSNMVVPIILLLLVAAIVGLLFVFLRVPSPPAVPIPTPNAYDQFIEIGKRVGDLPSEEDQKNADALGQFVSSHRVLLDELRLALNNDCVVPVEYSSDFLDAELNDISHMRQAARLLQYESAYHRLLDQPSEAAHIDLELLALARKLGNGGLMIHRLVGIAYEKRVLMDLADLAPQLSAAQKQEILPKLEAVPEKEPFELVIQRDTALGIQNLGRIRALLSRSMSQAANEKSRALEAEIDALEQRAMQMLSGK